MGKAALKDTSSFSGLILIKGILTRHPSSPLSSVLCMSLSSSNPSPCLGSSLVFQVQGPLAEGAADFPMAEMAPLSGSRSGVRSRGIGQETGGGAPTLGKTHLAPLSLASLP